MQHKCKLRSDSISHLPKLFSDAPWHDRLKRWANKLILVSENHPQTKNALKSRKAVEMESRRQVKHYQGFIIHPLSEFRRYWNIYIFSMLIFHQLLTPFAIGFVLDMNELIFDFLVFLDFSLCFILFIEVLLKFRTGIIIKETNEIILDPKLIARIYLKDFSFDLVSCVPFVFMTTHITVQQRYQTIDPGTIVLMLFLFIFSFLRFNKILFYFSTVPYTLKLTETATIIFRVCLRSVYCLHWAACLRRLNYYFLENNAPNWDNPNPNSTSDDTPVLDPLDESVDNILLTVLDETFQNSTIVNKYTRTMLITLKLVLRSGYSQETSDSVYNMLVTTFLMIAGWIYATYVLILISNVIMAGANSENKFEEMSTEIEAFCEDKNLVKTFLENLRRR